MLEDNDIATNNDLLDAKSTNFIQSNLSKTSTEGIFYPNGVDHKKGTDTGKYEEGSRSLHVPSLKLARRRSTTIISDGETHETDSTYFIQRNELAENVVNAKTNKSPKIAGRKKSLIKKEKNGKQIFSTRESIVNSEEDQLASSTNLKTLMISGEDADLRKEKVGSNDEFEGKLTNFSNISVGQKFELNNEENAASPKLLRRRQSFSEGSEISDPTKEIIINNNSGHRTSLSNEDITEQISCRMKVQSKSKETENEYLPSPNISRKMESFAKSGEVKTLEYSFSTFKEQNNSANFDDNETRIHKSTKDSSRKKSVLKSEYNENSFPVNRKRRQSYVTSREDETNGETVFTEIERRKDIVNEIETPPVSQQGEQILGGTNLLMTTNETLTQADIYQEQHQKYVEKDGVKNRGRRKSIIKKDNSRSQSASPNVQHRRKSIVKSEEKKTRTMQLSQRKICDADGNNTYKSKVTKSGRRKSIVRSENSGAHEDSPLNFPKTKKCVYTDEDFDKKASTVVNELSTCLGERRASVVSDNEDDEYNSSDHLQSQKMNDENNDKQIGACKFPRTFRKNKKNLKVVHSSRRTSLTYNANDSTELPEKADNKSEVETVFDFSSLCHETQAQTLSPLTNETSPSFNLTQSFAKMKMHDQISPRSLQRIKSLKATEDQGQFRGNGDMMLAIDICQDTDIQSSISTCEEKNRNITEDPIIKQKNGSQRVKQRRKSIQDANDIETRASRSPRLRHGRKLIQDAEDSTRHASGSPRVRQRTKLIQDAADTKRQASTSPRVRHRRKLIQNVDDTKRQASISPRVRQRRKFIQDSDDVKWQTNMSPKIQQRRKSIQDADEIKPQSMKSRPRRGSVKEPGDVTIRGPVSPHFQQRRKSIQDNEENMSQTFFSSRLRQRRKSIQDAKDIVTHPSSSPLLQQRKKFIQDSVDIQRQASLSLSLQQRRKSIHDNDETMRMAFLSTNIKQRRKSIQDSDEDMTQFSLSPLSQQKIKSFQYNDAIVGKGFMSPQLLRRRESIPEVGDDDVPTKMRFQPRRKSFQGGERAMPHFPTSHALSGRGKYMYDSDGMGARSLLSPSVRQMLQRIYDRRNQESPVEEGKVFDSLNINKDASSKDNQQDFSPTFESESNEYPASDPVTRQVLDNSYMLSSPWARRRLLAGTAPGTKEDVALPNSGRTRKMSLPVLSLHGNDIYEQSQQDPYSLTVMSLNQEGRQQIDGNISPLHVRDSKPSLVQKDIREKLAKSNRRSSFPAISGLSGILGMDIDVKQVELTENVAPFSRSARKARRASNISLSQNAPDPEPNKSKYRRKSSLPANMLTQFIQPGSEAMTNNMSCFQQTGQFEAPRRSTRRMSLPDASMSSCIGNSTMQSFCHHIPGEFRRNAAAKYIKSASENIASQENIYIDMDFEDITSDEEIFLGIDKPMTEPDDLPQRQSPTSPVVSDIDDNDGAKVQEDEDQNPLLEREYSMSEETILPPRTPKPAVMAELCENGNGPENQSNNGSSYQPRYCWCTRCELMYRMYKDEDSKLEAWGNYPCFKF